ncbi:MULTISPECIES: DUF5333 family protein [Rhizobium/Agrobacterium group]|uniref:DUF5333 family protein n=1 Tax=Rhizobium/Agrobacterium group TaxID=227290 RepID=UPI0023000380|nr:MULTISPECIES: DUF5333 family protein [Rhizobium/Agrobacterium group]MDA5632300.1 DUF5333 family protein [Agrobacterium sp. ST15.16.024]MDF1888163.1 DUF5333 family protein [Rhizobium rhizogenes]
MKIRLGVLAALVLMSCSTQEKSAQKPFSSADVGREMTAYTVMVAKARLVQRKCPELEMSFKALLAATEKYPAMQRISAGNNATAEIENSIDKTAVVDGITQFEAANGLRGADQKAFCRFGHEQIAKKTETGRLLQLKKAL